MPVPSQSAPSSQRLSRQSHSDALGRGLLIGGDEAQNALRLVQRSADRGPAMQEVLEQLVRLGRDSAPVWLYGETGAGRHTAALALHALSAVAAGPVLVVHRSELQDVIALWREQDRGAGQLLGAILARAAGGTAIFDEGGAPDLDFQGLVSDLLGLSERRDGGGKDGAHWPARLVLITAAQAAADLGMLAELLGRLGGRCVRVPPLRLRRGEIGALATELTARSGDGEAAGLDFGAAALLTDQPLRGNVRQLALAAARLAARRPAGGELIAPDVAEILGLRAEPPADPLALRATGQALGEVLRLVLPLVPEGAEAEGEEPPWAPLLLRRDERDPVGIFRLRAGPAPLDEAVVGAGLRPRPRGPIGAGGAGGGGAASGVRTGDEPSLSRLGPPWRGNLLGLLRALHRDLGSGELSLLDLGLALLLSGPPLPPQKLLRLVLRQPLDLTPEETAALLDRLELLQGGAPAQGRAPDGAAPRCEDPALGRSWADAMRGLVPRATQEALFRHARGCALCGEALWMSWRLPDLSGAGETLPLPVYPDGSPAPEVEPQVEPTTAARAAAISGAPAPAPTPAVLEPAAATASSAEAAPAASAQSPVAVPPTMAALRPGHWVALSLLLALALVAGTLFGQLLVKRGIHLF